MNSAALAEMDDALSGALVAGGATEEEVGAAEAELGVKLPPSYRRFLRLYGAALCDGYGLSGLFTYDPSEGPPQWTDVVEDTVRLRRVSRGAIPTSYVPVSGDGADCVYFIDTAVVDTDGESPVVALGPGMEDVTIAGSFAEYVVDAAKSE